MKRISTITLTSLLGVVLIAAGASAEASGPERYNPDPNASHVIVEGTSSMHDWEVEGHIIEGSLIFQAADLSSLWVSGGTVPRPLTPTVHVEIPVTSLKSGKRGMDKKMHEVLKAQTHPAITYRLESVELETRQPPQESDTKDSRTIEATGILTVAGAEQTVGIPMQVRQLSDDRLEITGGTSLRMTDFGIDPPKAMMGMLRTGDTITVRWTWVLVRHRLSDIEDNLRNTQEEPLNADVPAAGANQIRANPQTLLPVTAEALMPLETQQGVYLITEGSEKGKKVPFTFEQHGEQWILTKHEMARHELRRDQQGNIVIDRETNFRDDLEIEYASPVILLPATVDHDTSLTGKTRVIVRNARTKSVKYRGVCDWKLDFIGVGPVETPTGTFPVYRFRATREIRLSLARISMIVNFEYVRGKGMIATGIDQTIRSLGLFTDKEVWSLEQLPDTP